MKVLVAVGSKYGSTREIGSAIAKRLDSAGLEVTFSDACDVFGVDFFDAVVVGSAVYNRTWRKDATALVKDHKEALSTMPVWTFSVGMEKMVRHEDPELDITKLVRDIGARDHHYFSGALDFSRLNMGEKALIRALNPPIGDYRDFTEVDEWTDGIVSELVARAAL